MCSLLLSLASEGLRTLKEKNIEIDKKKNILNAIGINTISLSNIDIDNYYSENIDTLIIDINGATNNVLSIKTVQIAPFRILMTALKDILLETNITFRKDGIRIINMDKSHTILAHLFLRAENFELYECKEEKIVIIQEYFKNIMLTLGLDLNDDSLSGTPYRVAKMYVKEMFSGLGPKDKPKVSLFENKYQYGKMLIEKNISFYSCCEHHFLPVFGTAHVAYISTGKVIGLSKIHRIIDYFSNRPQVQERLTVQIFNELKDVLNTEDVAYFLMLLIYVFHQEE